MINAVALGAALSALATLQDDAPALEEVAVRLRDDTELMAQRGVLRTPIVRAVPESATIEIEFHRFFAEEEEHSKRPPIFLLHGGPGWRGLGNALRRPGSYEDVIQPLAGVADVVIVGQRGIGSSRPDTSCPRPEREALDVSVSEEEAAAAIVAACRTCKAKWEAEGLDLSGLNVIEAASDVIEVADALGYGKIQLMGGSFGSHWGMAILRFHPDRVERAILNGIEGPDHTYDMPSFVLNSLKRIAKSAESSPQLAGKVPEGGLIRAFERVIADVAKEPVVVEVGKYEVVLDARRLRDVALGYTASTGSRSGARTWPADVLRLARGDFKIAAEGLVRRNFVPNMPTASFFMLDCGSGISAERRAQLLADPAAEIVGALGSYYEAACPVWGSDLGEDFRKDFVTDVPTVLVHGTWDTSTPFENAIEILPCFRNGKLVVVEGGSHGALREAREASESFEEALLEFAATGDMTDLPELVELPPLDWVVPD